MNEIKNNTNKIQRGYNNMQLVEAAKEALADDLVWNTRKEKSENECEQKKNDANIENP